MVLQDRNHPSVVIYSVGNEIHDNLNDAEGLHKYTMQQNLVHSLDSTRPVTMALFRPALSHVYENGLADKMDVVGQNYRENELVAAHETKPQRIVIGTENGHVQSAWIALRDNPYMSGQFLWTGFDYLGENDWPKVVNGQGLYDRTGTARNIAYQRQSWWSDQPMVYTMRKEQNAGAGDWISDWSPTDIDTYDEARIQVFSNCDEVELFLNGKSLGAKPRPDDNASPRSWTTTFEKGTLKAVGRNKGKTVAEQELSTAGKAAKLVLHADKPSIQNSWDDVVYVYATVTDEKGNPVLTADNKVTFSIEGAGLIAAVDNGDLSSIEPFNAKERWAYKGTCIAIVKANAATGTIKITARANGLQDGSAMVTVQ
jgi:beta-galactosidase